MKKQNNFLKILCLTFLALLLTIPVSADDSEAGIGFEIRPIFSNTQLDTTKGFYYLETKPGENQQLEMTVSNTRDEDITLEFVIENAISAPNGNISYTDKLDKVHESLTDPITELVKPKDETIVLEPGENKVVSFDLTVPDSSYEGIKMGRVIVREKEEEEAAAGIGQVFQYGVGIIISETGEMFNDGDKLDLISVAPAVSNGLKVIQGEIINPDPKTIENLEVRAYVTKKGENNKLKQKNIDNFSFAPNSKVLFEIPWGLANFETGEYTFYFTAKNEFETFELTQDFKIRGEDVKKLNNEAAFAVNTPKFIKIIIVVLNAVLIILVIAIFIRNKKWMEELKTKKKQRKKNKSKRKK